MIIAHDLGTSGDKASLHDENGALVASCTVGYPTQFRPGGVAEQDPQDWWCAVGEASRRLLAQSGIGPASVRAVSMCGQMMGAVFLDSANRLVRPAFIWADQRSEAQAARLRTAVGQHQAYALLGHRVHSTYTLPKIMWVRENEQQTWADTHTVCVAKDYVTARLTGVLVTDPSDASSTDAYDLRAGMWSATMLDAAGVDVALLPEIVDSTTVAGSLTAAAADHTGLVRGTPVIVGGGDGPMASLGAGAVRSGDSAYVCLGSSAWVAFSSEQPLLDPQMRTFTFRHVVPGSYVPTATMQAGGACLQWIADVLEPGGGRGRIAGLLDEAATSRGADDGLYFLPYLLGERSPHWDSSAAGTFLGLQRHHTRGDLVLAVLEGVAFNLRTCMDAFADSGSVMSAVDVIGGGAASDVWLRVCSDVWGIPVRRRAIAEEAGSLGAAVTALVAIGAADFDVARTLSTTSVALEPDPDRTAAYAEQHAIFSDAHTRLAGWFGSRHGSAPTSTTEG